MSGGSNPIDSLITALPGSKGDATNALTALTLGIMPSQALAASKAAGLTGSGANMGNGIPSTLPTLGMTPQFYNPNSFAPRQNAPGIFNAMAGRLAGPQYMPTLMHPQGAPSVPQAPSSAAINPTLLHFLLNQNSTMPFHSPYKAV